MSKKESQSQVVSATNPSGISGFAGGKAALTEANRHRDVLLTSLAGVVAIVFVLMMALALPVFGKLPIHSLLIFGIMLLTALLGVGALSVINYRVHKEVTNQALMTEVLLNSLGQGFLSFNAQGVCSPVYSHACLDLLEGNPAGQKITKVLHLTEEQKNDFNDWIDMLFTPHHALGFEDVAKFLPQTFQHSDRGRHVALMYRPVHDNNGQLIRMILIATDLTEETEAQVRARAQQNYVDMICRIFKERGQFLTTITHLRNFVSESRRPVRREDSASVLRLLHTLKASAKHFSLDGVSNVIHRLEADLRNPNIRSDDEFQQRLRVGGDEVNTGIEAILEQAGELIGKDFEGQGKLREIEEGTIYDFARLMRSEGIDPEVVRQYLAAIAAVPINDAFHQFEREIKDLATIMGKKIKPIRFTGSNPRVLLQPMEGFMLAVMHISRNIIDHGIEPVVTRLARGKDPAGLVSIDTDLVDNPGNGRKMLRIVISDDGNGIDPALVRKKLAAIDPDGVWKNDSDEAVIQRILQWGVSTRTEISDISGRGVGMEAVDRELKLLGGTIRVHSDLYKGTRFDIYIPYGLDVPEKAIKKLA